MPKRPWLSWLSRILIVLALTLGQAVSAHTRCVAKVELFDGRLTVSGERQALRPAREFSVDEVWRPVSQRPSGQRAGAGGGVDAATVSFETLLPRTNERRDRVYAPALHFSDGNVAVFTGLVGTFLGLGDASTAAPCYIAADNAFVIGPGQKRLARVARPLSPGYVAFGRPNVLNRGPVTLVVDRSLPNWTLEYIIHEAEVATSGYRSRLGARSLPLLMVYTSGEGKAYFWGDHLGGTLMLGLYGDWRADTPTLRAKLREFIDHEIFHVWNSSASDHPEPTSLLSLEGGAELARVLLAFDRTGSSSSALSEVSDSLTRCQLEQAPPASLRSMLNSPHPGRIPYDCGMVLMFLMTVRPSGSTLDDSAFWHLWKQLLENSGRPPKYTWTAVVNSSHLRTATDSINRMLDGKDFDVAVGNAMQASGFQMHSRRILSSDLAALAGQKIMISLMSADCKGRVGFYYAAPGYRLDDELPTCGNLKAAKTIKDVAAIEPWVDPIALAAKIEELCGSGKPIPVTYADADVGSNLACSPSIRHFALSEISIGNK